MADILPSSGHFLGFVAKESSLKPAIPLLGFLGLLRDAQLWEPQFYSRAGRQ